MTKKDNSSKEITPFCLLNALPNDISHRILLLDCDGKSLSTLYLALVTSRNNSNTALADRLVVISRVKLFRIAKRIETEATRKTQQNFLSHHQVGGAVQWIRSVASIIPNGSIDTNIYNARSVSQLNLLKRRRMKVISENMAVLDFVRHSVREYSCSEQGRFEWPVWVGRLTVDSRVAAVRLRRVVRVIITAPMQRPSFMPGSSLMSNHVPAANFRCEHYNLLPIPPWGRVRSLSKTEEDQVLQPLAEQLVDSNLVAVPEPHYLHYGTDTLDIRIVLNTQAKRLLRSSRLRLEPRTSWILNNEDNNSNNQNKHSLVACWHEDDSAHEVLDDRDYIPYILALVKAMARLEETSEGYTHCTKN